MIDQDSAGRSVKDREIFCRPKLARDAFRCIRRSGDLSMSAIQQRLNVQSHSVQLRQYPAPTDLQHARVHSIHRAGRSGIASLRFVKMNPIVIIAVLATVKLRDGPLIAYHVRPDFTRCPFFATQRGWRDGIFWFHRIRPFLDHTARDVGPLRRARISSSQMGCSPRFLRINSVEPVVRRHLCCNVQNPSG